LWRKVQSGKRAALKLLLNGSVKFEDLAGNFGVVGSSRFEKAGERAHLGLPKCVGRLAMNSVQRVSAADDLLPAPVKWKKCQQNQRSPNANQPPFFSTKVNKVSLTL
jgi:hypothetical protein